MASKTLTAVPRGFLFCASHKPIEALDDSDEEDHLFAEPHSRRQEFLLGQIKNNLASKVMISHRYHMEPVTVGYDTEAQKDIKASKLTIHGLITQDVEDIVLEQEKARKGVRTQGTKAAAWLVGYLKGKGEVPSSQIKEDGKAADLSDDAINRARLKLVTERAPYVAEDWWRSVSSQLPLFGCSSTVPVEGPTLLVLAPSHGITVADLPSLAALVIAGLLLSSSRR
jgi:hypothetical protein